ncbi:hypothetical protein ACFLR8_04065 [Bacteroidota bacterium]
MSLIKSCKDELILYFSELILMTGNRTIMNYVWIYILSSAAIVLVTMGLYIWMPDHGINLYLEDGLFENLGALILLSTFVLGIPYAIKRNQHRVMLIFLSALGLLGFLIEVGFGKRLFSQHMPQFVWEIIDVFHDLFSMGYYAIKGIYKSQPFLLYLLTGTCVSIIVLLAWKYRHKIIGLNSKGYYTQTFILAMFFVLLFFASLFLDLADVHKVPLIALEEIIEMFAASALLFCSISLYGSRKSIRPQNK